ncbi:hypothetical protein EV359DRAFT_67984, partial [Lentinula novae-zelandiae]
NLAAETTIYLSTRHPGYTILAACITLISYIAGTNGYSNGFVLILWAHNTTARYVNQGDNKHPGAFAIYLEPWHVDIFAMIDLRKNYGKEEYETSETPGLHEVYGDDCEVLYKCYEWEGCATETIPAQKLWYHILEGQIETGNTFMLYKDACNAKSNQKNLGVIKSSNLCTEIVKYSSPDETAVCNLASLALPTYIVKDASGKPFSDFQKLHDVMKTARQSNMHNRPIGISVQGLADAFRLAQSQGTQQKNFRDNLPRRLTSGKPPSGNWAKTF